ncbi:MAG: hypothetical protein WAO20_02080 [Acidobacteriota bacterium]
MRKKSFLLVSFSLLWPMLLWGQHAAPLRVHVPLPAAWNAMHDALQGAELPVSDENQAQGTILTTYREYISGPLTESSLRKIGQVPKLADAYWIRADYRFDIQILFVEQKDTMVIVNAEVRGLKRDFLGQETWVSIPTNGSREEDLLMRFGKQLFGDTFSLDGSKKGLWERDRTWVPADLSGTVPRTTSPERP